MTNLGGIVDFSQLAEFGVSGLAMVALIVAAMAVWEFAKKKRTEYRESPNGDRRKPVMLDCPINPEGLTEVIRGLKGTLDRIDARYEMQLQTSLRTCENLEFLQKQHDSYSGSEIAGAVKTISRIDAGVRRILEDTGPNSEQIKILKESRDFLRDTSRGIDDLLGIAKKNGGGGK